MKKNLNKKTYKKGTEHMLSTMPCRMNILLSRL